MKIQNHARKDKTVNSTENRLIIQAKILQYLLDLSTTPNAWATKETLETHFGYTSFGSHLPFYSFRALERKGWIRRRTFTVNGRRLDHFQATTAGRQHRSFTKVKERYYHGILDFFQNNPNRNNIIRDEVAQSLNLATASTTHFLNSWKELQRLGFVVRTPGHRGHYSYNANPAPIAAPLPPSPFIKANPPAGAN